MKAAGPVPVELIVKSVVGLKITPVGRPPPVASDAEGILTTSVCGSPVALYTVAVPVPLLATHKRPVGPNAIPQGFTRCGSITGAPSALLSPMSGVTVKKFAIGTGVTKFPKGTLSSHALSPASVARAHTPPNVLAIRRIVPPVQLCSYEPGRRVRGARRAMTLTRNAPYGTREREGARLYSDVDAPGRQRGGGAEPSHAMHNR